MFCDHSFLPEAQLWGGDRAKRGGGVMSKQSSDLRHRKIHYAYSENETPLTRDVEPFRGPAVDHGNNDLGMSLYHGDSPW